MLSAADNRPRTLRLAETRLRAAALEVAVQLTEEGAAPRTPFEVACAAYMSECVLYRRQLPPPSFDGPRTPDLHVVREEEAAEEPVPGTTYAGVRYGDLVVLYRNRVSIGSCPAHARAVAELLLRDVFRLQRPEVRDAIATDCALALVAFRPELATDHWTFDASVACAFVANTDNHQGGI